MIRNFIKRLFHLYEKPVNPDYSQFTLHNLAIYSELYKTMTGKQLEVLDLSPENYLYYYSWLSPENNALSYRGMPTRIKLKVKKVK
jgi:hypothetical protein